jgi:hypothetical protein
MNFRKPRALEVERKKGNTIPRRTTSRGRLGAFPLSPAKRNDALLIHSFNFLQLTPIFPLAEAINSAVSARRGLSVVQVVP